MWVFDVGRLIPSEGGSPSEVLFADVQCIMLPKTPMGPTNSVAMHDAHEGYLAKRFRLAAKSADWRLYEADRASFGTVPL